MNKHQLRIQADILLGIARKPRIRKKRVARVPKFKDQFSKQERKEYGEKMNFFRSI